MDQPGWKQAENDLLKGSRVAVRRFAQEHPDELCSFFAYSIDADYAGVGLHLDTPANSLRRAQAHQRYQIQYRNEVFAGKRGWESARSLVAAPTNRIEDWNHTDPFSYELFAFVPVPVWQKAWEKYCQENGEAQAEELEGRIIITLWRAVERLVEDGTFDALKRARPFRIGFSFHDDEIIVLRILDWPDPGHKTEP